MAETGTAQGVFRFTDLPGEQRNSVYRHLFDDITTPDKPFHVWKEFEGLPRCNELATYTSLLLTCHQLKNEASSIFENDYLPHLTFYFDTLSELRKLTDPATDNKLKQSGARFLLKSPTELGSIAFSRTLHLMFEGTGSVWPRLPADCYWPTVNQVNNMRIYEKDGEMLGKVLKHDGVEYESRKLGIPSSLHVGVCYMRTTQYQMECTLVLKGLFTGIDWNKCDVQDEWDEMKSLELSLSPFEDEEEDWRQRSAARSQMMASLVNDTHSPPPMADMW